MTTADLDLAHLRGLLQAATPPADTFAALAEARAAVAGPLQDEMLQAEGHWLLGVADGAPDLAQPRADAAAALRRLRARNCASAPANDVDVLFELAIAAAAHRIAGESAAADTLLVELRARAESITDTVALCQEADERHAVFTAAGDPRALPMQIEAIGAAADALERIARRTRDRRVRRRARRARRGAVDRVLQLRMERLLGLRGAVLFDRVGALLLAVVLAVLVVESALTLTPSQSTALQWVDGVACAFFVVEFVLRCSLAPHRWSWTLRNVWTDLLPALPSVLWLLPGTSVSAGLGDVVLLRLLRLRVFRLVLFLVRGADGLVRRFQGLLDRRFVFLADRDPLPVADDGRRDLLFAALRRERSLLAALPAPERQSALAHALQRFAQRCDAAPGSWSAMTGMDGGGRDVAVESACELLWTLRPDDLERHLRPADLRALDRVVRVVSAPPLCWLPILRRLAVRPLPLLPEQRVVAAGRRVADWLMGWQDRLLFYADLHGIVTGPQILDRVASAMVKASQRPAVRLLFFGGLFLLFDLLIRNQGISQWLQRIVVGPLLVLGSVCLVFLMLGWWLKRVAGEASESFRLTAEAHFVVLLDLAKWRHERRDTEFLGRRVLGDATAGDAVQLLRLQLASARAGVPLDLAGFDRREEGLGSRVALLYLHFLHGALLHGSDVKTTEQLLANSSLENLRHGHLGWSKKDRKRLRTLRLDDGSVLRGPFLWFRFITESVAVEASKRITEYNRRCVPLERRAALDPAQERALRGWLAHRCDPKVGRTLERLPPPDAGTVFASTEFHALHFLSNDAERDAHVAATFGDDVLAALRADRRNMIREIFGMRPPRDLDESMRSLNLWRIYWARLSHGRILLLPLLFAFRLLRGVAWFVARLRQIVREVLTPHLAMQRREPGRATFAVALRKIHRMKAPGLLEAIRLRVQVDPDYCGAPSAWTTAGATVAASLTAPAASSTAPAAFPTAPAGFPTAPAGSSTAPAGSPSQLERDLDFLRLHEREKAEFRAQAEHNRELVATLRAALSWLPAIDRTNDPVARADGELAVTSAWLCDRDAVRTLLGAEAWRVGELPALLQRRVAVGQLRRFLWWVADKCREHPVDRWLARMQVAAGGRGRRALRHAYVADARVRATIDAWNRLPDGTGPAQLAIERLRAIHAAGGDTRRELVALRAVQSLSVLDVRNYRDAVFALGGFADDGEDPGLATELP